MSSRWFQWSAAPFSGGSRYSGYEGLGLGVGQVADAQQRSFLALMKLNVRLPKPCMCR